MPLGSLHIGFERAAKQAEILGLRRYARAPRRARELLAIGAVADRAEPGIDRGLVSDAAAMAFSVDVHDNVPLKLRHHPR